jgi:hypothetical protein
MRRLQTRDSAPVDIQFDKAWAAPDLQFDPRVRGELGPAHEHFDGACEVAITQDLAMRLGEFDHSQLGGPRGRRVGLRRRRGGRQQGQKHGRFEQPQRRKT